MQINVTTIIVTHDFLMPMLISRNGCFNFEFFFIYILHQRICINMLCGHDMDIPHQINKFP